MHQPDRSHELQHDDPDRSGSRDTGADPGRSSRSASLLAPTAPVPSGIIQRKARDANGVAGDADHAVATAASSSGSSLPETIQRKFEGSLGADLSSVRIHTGAQSAAAAEAVGARAYTTGQDIHFGAGQYDPSSAGGEHLLAHEVAHTVQQRGGSPVRQNKLAVSAPHDAAEHEADRAADAMVSGQAAVVTAPASALMRDPEKDSKKKEAEAYKGPTPDEPFEMTDADQVKIDDLGRAELAQLAAGDVGQGYVNFNGACHDAIRLVDKKDLEEQQAKAKAIDFAFGALGMLAGPLGSAVAGAAPGKALQSSLKDAIYAKLPTVELALVKGRVVPRKLPSTLYDTVASKTATDLAAKLTPSATESLIGAAAGKVGSVVKEIKSASPHQMAVNYLHAMQDAAHVSAAKLRQTVANSRDPEALVGVHARYTAATPSIFRGEVEEKALHFVDQVGKTQTGGHGVGIMDAYGRTRLFTYSTITDDLRSGIAYRFESWVTPDMQPMVFALNPNPKRFSPSDANLRGRIPEPTIEAAHGAVGGGATAGETIVRMNAYGGPRLAAITTDVSMMGKTKYKFLRWISEQEQGEATARGQQQLGGIVDFDPSKIEGHLPQPAK